MIALRCHGKNTLTVLRFAENPDRRQSDVLRSAPLSRVTSAGAQPTYTLSAAGSLMENENKNSVLLGRILLSGQRPREMSTVSTSSPLFEAAGNDLDEYKLGTAIPIEGQL